MNSVDAPKMIDRKEEEMKRFHHLFNKDFNVDDDYSIMIDSVLWIIMPGYGYHLGIGHYDNDY